MRLPFDSSSTPVGGSSDQTLPTAIYSPPLQLPQASRREIDQPGRLYFGPHFCIRATPQGHLLTQNENSANVPVEEPFGPPETTPQAFCPTLYSIAHLHLETLRLSYRSELVSSRGGQPLRLQFEYSSTVQGTVYFYWYVREQRQDAISPVPQYIPTAQTLPVSHCPMEVGDRRYVDLSFDFGEFHESWWQDSTKSDNTRHEPCVSPQTTTEIARQTADVGVPAVGTDRDCCDLPLQRDQTRSETVLSPTHAPCSVPIVQPIQANSGGQGSVIPLVIFFTSEAKDVTIPDSVIYHVWIGIPSSPPPVDSSSLQPLFSSNRDPEERPHHYRPLPRVTHTKQKVIVDGHRYITQEIFGIDESQITEEPLTSPSSVETPPDPPLTNETSPIPQMVTSPNITPWRSAERFQKIEPTLVSSITKLTQQSIGYTDHGNESEHPRECVICLTSPRTVVLLPCRHMCACLPCAEALEAQSAQCPVCRLEFSTLLFLATPSAVEE